MNDFLPFVFFMVKWSLHKQTILIIILYLILFRITAVNFQAGKTANCSALVATTLVCCHCRHRGLAGLASHGVPAYIALIITLLNTKWHFSSEKVSPLMWRTSRSSSGTQKCTAWSLGKLWSSFPSLCFWWTFKAAIIHLFIDFSTISSQQGIPSQHCLL